MPKLPVILLVDDDSDYRALVGDALSSAGIACELQQAGGATPTPPAPT